MLLGLENTGRKGMLQVIRELERLKRRHEDWAERTNRGTDVNG